MNKSGADENLQPIDYKERRVNRLTVFTQVSHERSGERATSIPMSYSELLQVEEDIYARRQSADAIWSTLDFGWLGSEQAGLIIIENLEGREKGTQPTPEELRKRSALVLEVAVEGAEEAFFPIPPRRHWPFWNAHPERLRIRCQGGKASYKIIVMPK